MSEFEEFDPSQSEEFEDYDVAADADAENVMAAFGDLVDSQDQARALSAARDEVERLLMGPREVANAAFADEEPYGSENIVGVGIGEKVIGGIPTGQLAVKVLVKEKQPLRLVTGEAVVPESINGVLTDVEQTGEIRAFRFTARRRPAPCGVSIGNCTRVMAGTLGCLVTRNNQLFILSNNHVMALVNSSPLNAGICQPGRLDGGVCPQDIIARLTQFVPIDFTPGANNLVDCAIARTSPLLVERRLLRLLGAVQPIAAGIAAPVLGMRVQKSGRTTQYRQGVIDMVNTTVNVSYAPLGGIARFVGQFRVRGTGGIFSDSGDSGSLVTSLAKNQPVGLLFAGNAANNVTFCNPIRPVLAAFGVSIVI
jgi:hypothetical protein